MATTGDDDGGKMKNKNVLKLVAQQRADSKRKSKSEPPAQDDGRPIITVAAGMRPKVLDEADAALGQNDQEIFDHMGRLVRLTKPGEIRPARADAIQRQGDAILLREVIAANLCDRLARVARFRRWDARIGDYATCDVPKAVADGLLARSGEWRHIRPLRGFVEAPTLRDDGSILDVTGYDHASELYFAGKLPIGYERPKETREDAKFAAEFIEDQLADLPFVDPADRAALLAGILMALVRRVMPSAPLIGITAPAPGTGKSMVADAISIIATGRRAAVLGLGKDDIEGDKRLAGALLAGDAVIAIDNVERPVFGDLICQALTQPTIRIRALGRSELLATPTNNVLIITANNIDIRGDLRRRVMLVRLDAKTERPELRKFDRDFLSDVLARRGEIIRAGLTIVRAYLADGKRVSIAPFGSFEHWSHWCREPLIWLDRPDPLEASTSLREQDPDLVAQRQLFAAWWQIFESRPVIAAEVIRAAETDSDLRGALDTVCAERIAPRRLSTWLRRHRDRVLDAMRLESAEADSKTKIARWRLVRV